MSGKKLQEALQRMALIEPWNWVDGATDLIL